MLRCSGHAHAQFTWLPCRFGGSYVPETLVAALTELEKSYKDIQKDTSFQVFEQTPQLVASAVRSCTKAVG